MEESFLDYGQRLKVEKIITGHHPTSQRTTVAVRNDVCMCCVCVCMCVYVLCVYVCVYECMRSYANVMHAVTCTIAYMILFQM